MTDVHFDETGRLFDARYGDHFHADGDGAAESAHVFLAGNGLPGRWKDRHAFRIGELGFGTGLNLLVAWSEARQGAPDMRLDFVSLDAHPLSRAQAQRALSRWTGLTPYASRLLDVWDDLASGVALDERTTARVIHADVNVALATYPDDVDAWFLDGFSPSGNPAMWSAEAMAMLAARTATGGTVATYTAAGWVRRNLAAAGFAVERVAGFGRKRHMTIGQRR